MTSIAIEGVSRAFGSVRAVREVSLLIGEGEFFTLLGPSGCGKTTLLRMIAGFAELDAGASPSATAASTACRRTGATPAWCSRTTPCSPISTWPATSPTASRRGAWRGAEIARARRGGVRTRAARGHGGRWPHQLSGGQLQRVAIARALVIEPEVLLLDEPLSNLDAQLRVEMRGEIRQLQQTLGITAIYVTHDQEEALAISDRIAVMRGGSLEQIGRPDEIYRHPATPFVAEFMGITNLLTGTVVESDGAGVVVRVGDAEFPLGGIAAATGAPLTFCLRPEALRLLAPGEVPPDGWATLAATLARVEFLGALTRLELRLSDGTPLRAALLDRPVQGISESDVLSLAYDPRRLVAFGPS